MKIYGFKKDYKKPLLYIPCLPCKRCHLNFLPVSHGQQMCLDCLNKLNQVQNIHKFEIKLPRESIIEDILLTWSQDDSFKEIQAIITFTNDAYIKQSWYTIYSKYNV